MSEHLSEEQQAFRRRLAELHATRQGVRGGGAVPSACPGALTIPGVSILPGPLLGFPQNPAVAPPPPSVPSPGLHQDPVAAHDEDWSVLSATQQRDEWKRLMTELLDQHRSPQFFDFGAVRPVGKPFAWEDRDAEPGEAQRSNDAVLRRFDYVIPFRVRFPDEAPNPAPMPVLESTEFDSDEPFVLLGKPALRIHDSVVVDGPIPSLVLLLCPRCGVRRPLKEVANDPRAELRFKGYTCHARCRNEACDYQGPMVKGSLQPVRSVPSQRLDRKELP